MISMLSQSIYSQNLFDIKAPVTKKGMRIRRLERVATENLKQNSLTFKSVES